MAMKKSRWFTPYTLVKGRLIPSIRGCWTCAQAGVYLIRNARSQKICYIGSSTNQLKKTIYRHFQQWNDKSRGRSGYERKTYPKEGYEIRFIKCYADKALKLEKYLINKHRPKDNPLKYDQLTKAAITAGEKIENEFHNDAILLNKQSYWVGMEEAPF